MKLPSILNLKMLSGAGLNSQINDVQLDALGWFNPISRT